MSGDERFLLPGTTAIQAERRASFDAAWPSVFIDQAGTWATFHRDERQVVVRDLDGRPVRRHVFPALPPAPDDRPGRAEAFAADLAPDRCRLVHMTRDRLLIHAELGVIAEHPHVPWGGWVGAAACFARGGAEVWAALPQETGDRQIRRGQLTLIDATTGRPLDRVVLGDDWPEAYQLVRHPMADAAVLDAGYGQDGTWLWTVRTNDDGIEVRRLGSTDQIMGGFAPDGRRFVTAPHDVEAMVVRGWPDGLPLVQVSNRELFEAEPGEDEADWLWYHASFLDDRTVIAQTGQGLLVRVTIEGPHEVVLVALDGYEAGSGDGAGDLLWFDVVGPRSFVTRHATGRLDLWSLS